MNHVFGPLRFHTNWHPLYIFSFSSYFNILFVNHGVKLCPFSMFISLFSGFVVFWSFSNRILVLPMEIKPVFYGNVCFRLAFLFAVCNILCFLAVLSHQVSRYVQMFVMHMMTLAGEKKEYFRFVLSKVHLLHTTSLSRSAVYEWLSEEKVVCHSVKLHFMSSSFFYFMILHSIYV